MLACRTIALCMFVVSLGAAARAAELADVELIPFGQWHAEPEETFMIVHGQGGTRSGDRFHRLAEQIAAARPRTNVLLVDWTAHASATTLFGLPDPWTTARQIEPVAATVASKLARLGVDPSRLTLIGESFGNWVNDGAAEHLGGARRILAFNPASELGGFAPRDLRRHSQISWSFQTWSACDTRLAIADRGFLLQTPRGADDLAQHTFGVEWLRARLAAGDERWLLAEMPVPDASADRFDAVAGLGGDLLAEQPLRQPAATAARQADPASL